MSIPKNSNPTPALNVDSFETNLLQIEQTDKLLSNLELKLAKLFSKNVLSPQNIDNNLQQQNKTKSPSSPSRSQRKVSQHDELNVSPPNPNDTSKISSLSVSEQNFYQYNNNNEKIINSSRYSDFKPAIPQFLSFPEQKQSPYDFPYNPNSSQGNFKFDRENLDLIDLTETKGSCIEYNKENVMGKLETFGPETASFAKRDFKGSFSRRNMEGNLRNNSGDLLDKMGKVEQFYKEKIVILEERLLTTEEELEKKTKIIDKLKKENEELQGIIKENQVREDSFQEIEYKWNQKEQEWKEEKRILEENFEGMRIMFKNVVNEKEDLETKYESLMNIHRQMIQLDMEKNQKILEGSMREKFETTKKDEKIESLKLTIQKYKEELDYMKENNYLIRKQYLFEINGLKAELGDQRKINKRLKENDINENRGKRLVQKREDLSTSSISYMPSVSVRDWKDSQNQGDLGSEKLFQKERRNKSLSYENAILE